MKTYKYLCTLVFLLLFSHLSAQQVPDSLFRAPVFDALYDDGKGPVVYIDEAHYNFHTRDGRYMAFANVVEQDGFRVKSLDKEFTPKALKDVRMLVISNALPVTSVEEWVAPTASAFSKEEIKALEHWVRDGGRLWLIADHMPMGGAAKDLAAAFGFTFYDGFADDTTIRGGSDLFTLADNNLINNQITHGVRGFLPVDSVRSFTGQAFEIPDEATSILNCRKGWILAMPDTAWVFHEDTPRLDASEFSQGAFMEYGKGKVVMFGEAAMFSAQIAYVDGRSFKAGMNTPAGKNNYKLLVNIVRWLDE